MQCASDSFVLILALALAACSDASIAMNDSGDGAGDAGGHEAGSIDAGPGESDAGPTDAGSPADGGPDASGYPTPAAGEIVITEIMPDSDVVTDDCGEWFEIYNPSADVTYNLRGCTFRDLSNAHTVGTDLIIGPGELLSLARYEAEPYCNTMLGITGPGFAFDYSYGATVKLGNEGDTLTVACGGATVDAVDFTAWTIVKGASFNLDPDSFDATTNDDGASWCSGVNVYNMAAGEVDRGTPGAANTDC